MASISWELAIAKDRKRAGRGCFDVRILTVNDERQKTVIRPKGPSQPSSPTVQPFQRIGPRSLWAVFATAPVSEVYFNRTIE